MTRHLFLIFLGVDFTPAHVARKAVKAKSAQSAVNRGVTHPNIVITLQVPNDANRTQLIFASQVDDLCNDFRWHFTGMVPGSCGFVSKPRLALFIVLGLPSVEGGSGKSEVATGHTHIADLFGVFQYA